MSENGEEKEKRLENLKIGDKIQFGNYPFYEDGREKAIDWLILDIDRKGNALLISDYCLDNVSYNKHFADITWERSYIRKWLNDDFLNKAFTAIEQSKIMTTKVSTADNRGKWSYGSSWHTRGGNDTDDKLFLLSIEEAEKYFKDDESRTAYPTPYAKSEKSVKGRLYVDDDHVSTDRGGSCWWWLRSPGFRQDYAALVEHVGPVYSKGNYVNSGLGAVRVAFRINLNNLYDKIHNSEEITNVESTTVQYDKESSLKSHQAQQSAIARQPTTRQYNVGDKIQFGSYHFYPDGRAKEIDWIILDIDADNNALLISDYALDNVIYNEKRVDITWEDSSIRKWLNNDFLNKAFTATEQSKIMTTKVSTADNQGKMSYGSYDSNWHTRGGNDTYDKLFLLSIEEANKYFSDRARIAYPTPYAKSKISVNGYLYVDDDHVSTDRGGSCWWWLRSPGDGQRYAARIGIDGSVHSCGCDVLVASGAVRVVFRINLNNLYDKIHNSEEITNIASITVQCDKKFSLKSYQAQQSTTARQTTTRQYNVGDKIQFGSYPFYAYGVEKPIDWIILDIDADNNALVISDYCLDNVSYNEEDEDITWEESTIRKWLNNDFLNKAFTPEQQIKIIESRIENNDNARHNTIGGNATTDNLFLLSIEEAYKYFNNDESRIAYPTQYAKSNKSVNGNLYVNDDHVSTDRGGSCMWWLRSPGGRQYEAAYVNCCGDYPNHGGAGVRYVYNAVRMAYRINLNNLYDKIHNSEEITNIASTTVQCDKKSSLKSYQAQQSAIARQSTTRQYNVGDIKFGSYPYEADGTEKPIEWIILEKYLDGSALLISKYGLDARRFDAKISKWERSEIRQWLNNEFYNAAFNDEEKEAILDYREAGCCKIFLLSVEEAEKYFKNNEDRKAWPTPYTKERGAYTNANYGGSCWWWLRSPRFRQDYAALVFRDGSVTSSCYYSPSSNLYAVRVAFRIDLNILYDKIHNSEEITNIASTTVQCDKKSSLKSHQAQQFAIARHSTTRQYTVRDIKFGSYPYKADGTEKPIEWIILEKYSDGTALLISKYGLYARRFDASSNNWERSEIRQWLNNEFYNATFKDEEKEAILEYREAGCKLFLLSVEEAEKYFKNDYDRMAWPTSYAKEKGAYTNDDSGGSCWWWLRSPGYFQLTAALVSSDGVVDSGGYYVSDDRGAVRVALKINLNNL